MNLRELRTGQPSAFELSENNLHVCGKNFPKGNTPAATPEIAVSSLARAAAALRSGIAVDFFFSVCQFVRFGRVRFCCFAAPACEFNYRRTVVSVNWKGARLTWLGHSA